MIRMCGSIVILLISLLVQYSGLLIRPTLLGLAYFENKLDSVNPRRIVEQVASDSENLGG